MHWHYEIAVLKVYTDTLVRTSTVSLYTIIEEEQLQMESYEIKEIMETASARCNSKWKYGCQLQIPVQAHAKLKRDKNGIPTAPQAKNPDGTAKNALDVKANIMGTPIKR